MTEALGPSQRDWRADFTAALPTSSNALNTTVTRRATARGGLVVPVNQVLVARPLGFCAGVERAISALNVMVEENPGAPVYCRNVIVHNDGVKKYFEGRGVTFFKDFDEVPDGAPIMLSAHGSSPDTVAQAKAKSDTVVDAVCPLVSKVHREIERSPGEIVYIGHPGHDESDEAKKIAPERVHIVASPDDVDALTNRIGNGEPVSVLMQTTLAQGEWEEVDRRAGELFDAQRPPKKDICFATTNRQVALHKMIGAGAETVLVVTSRTSSNGNALHRVAEKAGVKSFIIDDRAELPDAIRDTVVGITAAASTPGEQILDIMSQLDPQRGIHFVDGVEETETFPKLPAGLGRRQ